MYDYGGRGGGGGGVASLYLVFIDVQLHKLMLQNQLGTEEHEAYI